MKLAGIAFTKNGCHLGKKAEKRLEAAGHICRVYTLDKYASSYELLPLQESLGEWTRKRFQDCDGILFIGACGIAVRSIAPFLRDKEKDPAVLVMDEKGDYVISLLSGHVGGANALAEQLGALLGAVPVITTATDKNHLFAVDVFAKRNGLKLSDRTVAKEISALLLAGGTVGFYSELEVEGEAPTEIETRMPLKKVNTVGIQVTIREVLPVFEKTLFLRPVIVIIGIGCKRGIGLEAMEEEVFSALQRERLSFSCIKELVSIDRKKDEIGILEFSKKYQIPFRVFTAEELLMAEGEFTESPFVESVVGVGNVCERAAILAAGQGVLLQKKVGKNGVTTAIAVELKKLQWN